MSVLDRATAVRDHFMALPLPARALAGSVFAGAALIVISGVAWLGTWWVASAQQVDTLEPRVAQILGFIESQQKVESALSQREKLLLTMVFPDSGSSGRGGAVLQERVRNLSAEAGLTVIGSEVLEPEVLEDRVKLKLGTKVAGPPGALIEFFRRLNEERPFLFVTAFTVNAQRQLPQGAAGRGQSAEANLSVDIAVHAYQVAPQR